MFGRGSEELTALRAQGIATGVCPGITAALGCSASAGMHHHHEMDDEDELPATTARTSVRV